MRCRLTLRHNCTTAPLPAKWKGGRLFSRKPSPKKFKRLDIKLIFLLQTHYHAILNIKMRDSPRLTPRLKAG
jgi:hypothetical protein